MKYCSASDGPGVGRLEEQAGRASVTARPSQASALEVDPRSRDVAPGRECDGLVDERIAADEVAPKTLDARELRQHLRPSGVRGLIRQPLTEALLGPVEVVEVPQGLRRSSTVGSVLPHYARAVELSVSPPVDESTERALDTRAPRDRDRLTVPARI